MALIYELRKQTNINYNLISCDCCDAYICGLCNLFIPEEKVKIYDMNDIRHLKRIFDKHLLKCSKSTINEQYFLYKLKYCLGCQKEFNLIDELS